MTRSIGLGLVSRLHKLAHTRESLLKFQTEGGQCRSKGRIKPWMIHGWRITKQRITVLFSRMQQLRLDMNLWTPIYENDQLENHRNCRHQRRLVPPHELRTHLYEFPAIGLHFPLLHWTKHIGDIQTDQAISFESIPQILIFCCELSKDSIYLACTIKESVW